jgi:hypothetical protein
LDDVADHNAADRVLFSLLPVQFFLTALAFRHYKKFRSDLAVWIDL